ncbi:hypothetical protein LCGC14_0322000 [marine sediment metagenome]|uniref:Uncharacterized protein n=1 Tax=marine sediment metagenome TaxID=412755 RepID=A0A0F9W6C1_9ZZZZ
MQEWRNRARSIFDSALVNLATFYFFFIRPKIFLSRVTRSPSIYDGIKFVLWSILLVGVLDEISDRLFHYAGFDSFGGFVSCDFQAAREFVERPEIERWLNERREFAIDKQIPSPEYLGIKFLGSGLQGASGDPEVDMQNDKVLEFGLSTKIAFPQYCLLDAEVPQLAFVKFGFASILFDKVRRDDIRNDAVAVIFLLTISAVFSISVWFALLRLGTHVDVRSVFLVSLYSTTIWHGLVYVPQSLFGIYYSFDGNLSLHFDLRDYYLERSLYLFSSALIVLGYLFAYLKKVSRARLWKIMTGTLIGAGVSCLLAPLVIVPILFVIFQFGYWLGLFML